ncbi:DUF1572 family protein [Psychrobacillus sp. FSL K6-2684]|uniref:DUF1572 family protein n=1 Tax=Psychrobacillus faecigallinarum TaxID=2762235 RepID=A0ABR8R484_9BACI|nr:MULTISPECIES: DUF1572 family protein [Psychrobacillus]MBD7942600.1 DUF1572 family protein [Psychrobacillus faecigallinarum]QEY22907.1 DUF1572 domain-containing protein [Psychrobacillus sp. AK 1817]
MSIESEYLLAVKKRFESMKALGDKTFNQLSEEDIHWTLNEESNSIAIIGKHMSGNMISRWTDFLTSDGEKLNRNRDSEFEDNNITKRNLQSMWENGWHVLMKALNELKEEDLLKIVYIRGEDHSVIEAIERQLAHQSYHVGQIVYIGKLIKNKEWKNLSIPKGKSDDYLRQMLEQNANEKRSYH